MSIERGGVLLAFWRCGHVEVDDGTEHECDGRDVCMADFERYVPASQLAAAVDALRSIAGKSRPSGEYCQRVARLALVKLGDEHYTPRGQPNG